jgi:hypothetical protein
MRSDPRLAVVLALLIASPLSQAADTPIVSFVQEEGRLRIRIADQAFADYVFQDRVITRPYFCNVHAPGGVPVTRQHPPVQGKDATDHATMHPGIWLAFGDLSVQDCWRNKAPVRHEKFLAAPKGGPGRGSFAVLNRYLTEDGKKVIARESCRLTIEVRPQGHLLLWNSTFEKAEADCVFGDQEEMGLGVRLATSLTVKAGGQIVNSDSKRNERQVWGQQADWCDYSGTTASQRVGLLLMPDPANFRRSWFHARDYGLLVANPFGQNAFTRGPKSRVALKEGEPLRLRFGILVHAGPERKAQDWARAYQDFLERLKE